jgi:hypothetical protein
VGHAHVSPAVSRSTQQQALLDGGTAQTRNLQRRVQSVRRLVQVVKHSRRASVASAYRQREGEGGPPARLALDPDPAAVQLDELLGQGQPEARTFLVAPLIASDLAELLEDSRPVLRSDPDAGVADSDLDRPLPPVGAQRDPAPSG